MRSKLMLFLLVLLCWNLQQAHAQLLFNLNPADLSERQGGTVTFNATLKNTGSETIFLNGASSDVSPAGLQLDNSPFFTNFPFFLTGGDSVTADIFTISIDNSLPQGSYIGSFAILGGSEFAAQDIVAQQNFLVNVSNVPEPGTLPMLGAAVVVTGLLLRCRKR